MIRVPRGRGSLRRLNPLVCCLVFTPGTISLQICNPDYPQYPITDANPQPRTLHAVSARGCIMVSLSNFISAEPMQIFLVSKHLPIAQFVVVLRFFLSCMLPQITVPVTDKLVFACFPGFYGTAGCYTWRHVLFWAGVTAAGNKHCNENMIFLRRRKRFCLQLREKKERNKEWMMVESTFGDGPANFCKICPNGSSLGVIKKRKKKYNMHDMTSNQKHTKNDLLRLKNKSVDERKDFFFFFFLKRMLLSCQKQCQSWETNCHCKTRWANKLQF